MATLADVTAKWQTQATADLKNADLGAKAAQTAADKAAEDVKTAQNAVAGLVTQESALLASLDEAPTPADLEQLKGELIDVRRDLRQARSTHATKNLEADVAARAAVRAQAAVAAAAYELSVASGAAKDADGLKIQVENLTKATTDEPVKSVRERAKSAKSDELAKAKQHIETQIGEKLLELAQAQAEAVRAETRAAQVRLECARSVKAEISDESDSHAALLASIDALAQYVGSSVGRLDAAIARLHATAGSAKASQDAIDALKAAVDDEANAATHLTGERTAAAALTKAEADHTVAEWHHKALGMLLPAADPKVVKAKEALDKTAEKRDGAKTEHDTAIGAVTPKDKAARTAWNDAVPITLWPLLTDLIEASATMNELADCDPAALITDVTEADSKAAADGVTAKLHRSKAVQAVVNYLDARADDLAATEASESTRLAAALNT